MKTKLDTFEIPLEDRFTVERIVLDNGLRILISPTPHVHSVSVCFFLKTGSRYEPEELGGVSHFIEHLLFKGTAKRPRAQDIASAVEGIGGILNAGTGRDMTDYWAKVAQPHLPVALDVLSDMLQNSLFEEEEIEKERQVIAEEINMLVDMPDSLVQMIINALQWPDNPIGREILGTPESVAHISRDDMLNYMSRHYGPENVVLAISGNISIPNTIEMVRDHLESWIGGGHQEYVPFQGTQTEPRVDVVHRPIEQGHLCINVPALSRHDPDRFKLRLLNTILGEGMSSRLFLEIREKQGLAYSVESYTDSLDETGIIGTYAGVAPENIDQAIVAIIGEWTRIKEEPIPEEELIKAREFIKGRLLLRMEDTFSIAQWNGQQELLQPQILSLDEVIGRLDSITSDQIQDLAQRLFIPSQINLAIVGPFGTASHPDNQRFYELLNSSTFNSV